jgi:hypothetical protein
MWIKWELAQPTGCVKLLAAKAAPRTQRGEVSIVKESQKWTTDPYKRVQLVYLDQSKLGIRASALSK